MWKKEPLQESLHAPFLCLQPHGPLPFHWSANEDALRLDTNELQNLSFETGELSHAPALYATIDVEKRTSTDALDRAEPSEQTRGADGFKRRSLTMHVHRRRSRAFAFKRRHQRKSAKPYADRLSSSADASQPPCSLSGDPNSFWAHGLRLRLTGLTRGVNSFQGNQRDSI
jgi:hypothetical protein